MERVEILVPEPWFLIDETGSEDTRCLGVLTTTTATPRSPLPRIALPVRSGEEGKNLGAANDFTVYSGPFVGVRGMSEHIARSVFSSGGNNGVNDMSSTVNCSDTFTVVFPVSFKADYWNTPIKWHDGTRIRFELKLSGRSSGSIELKAYSSSGTEIFRAYKDIAGSLIYGEWSPFYLSIDRSEGIFKAYYKDTLIDLAVQNNGSFYIGSIGIFGRTADGYSAPCEIGPMYFTDSAVNIASEEIRNLFFDQLGNSKDLTPAIQEGLIPAPIFHLEFIDTNDLGLDSSGNNNHFTVNGNVTPGADFHA